MSVTERDRERAMHVMAWDPLSYAEFAKAVRDGGAPDDRDALETVDDIAQALADERERAQAPFLALADEFDANLNWREWGIGNRIRHAAEDKP